MKRLNEFPHKSSSLLKRNGFAVAPLGLLGLLGLFVGCQEAVPPATDEHLMAQWENPPEQCMGFDDVEQGIYRTSGDPNPKGGDPCHPMRGTSEGGHCNVPCGFTLKGQSIGNKSCECNSGFFIDCSCSPLPSYAEQIPQFVGSCEDEPGAPELGSYSQDNNDLFADHMNGTECTVDFDACMTPDLPRLNGEGKCEYTTPKGCICLGGYWQCGSTNAWFFCKGDDCPQAYLDAGVRNGNLKESALCR